MPKIIVGELKLGEPLQEHIVSDSSCVRIIDDSRRTAYVIRLMPDGKTLEITAGEPFADSAGNICGRTLAVVPAEPTRIFVRAEKYGGDATGRARGIGGIDANGDEWTKLELPKTGGLDRLAFVRQWSEPGEEADGGVACESF